MRKQAEDHDVRAIAVAHEPHGDCGRMTSARRTDGDRSILVLNAGSSSVKFALWTIDPAEGGLRRAARGAATGLGRRGRFEVRDGAGRVLAQSDAGIAGHAAALAAVFDWLEARHVGRSLAAVGHRVVHGGVRYAAPVLCTAQVLAEVEALTPLAPAHQPFSLEGVRAAGRRHPDLPQVLCFDTAFHRDQPAVARRMALPRALHREGVMNYGFHGLSYEYIAGALADYSAEAAHGRVVVAHLGHGASMCALRDRRSVATTMTFSPLDGLPMGRRCGTLDPGVVLYLLREKGMTVERVTQLLNAESGLLGVSGLSEDMRDLLASADPHAREAVDLFVYRAGRELGSLAAALGGLDALVFTAGVGQHAAAVRERICTGAGWLGLALDAAANARGGPRISSDASRVSAWVIPTDEERIIARHTAALAGLA